MPAPQARSSPSFMRPRGPKRHMAYSQRSTNNPRSMACRRPTGNLYKLPPHALRICQILLDPRCSSICLLEWLRLCGRVPTRWPRFLSRTNGHPISHEPIGCATKPGPRSERSLAWRNDAANSFLATTPQATQGVERHSTKGQRMAKRLES